MILYVQRIIACVLHRWNSNIATNAYCDVKVRDFIFLFPIANWYSFHLFDIFLYKGWNKHCCWLDQVRHTINFYVSGCQAHVYFIFVPIFAVKLIRHSVIYCKCKTHFMSWYLILHLLLTPMYSFTLLLHRWCGMLQVYYLLLK